MKIQVASKIIDKRGAFCVIMAFCCLLITTTSISWGQEISRISVNDNGNEGNGRSTRPSISADGRFIAFSSDADNLVPGDTNLVRDVFLYDHQTDQVSRVSVDSAGNQSNGKSDRPSISSDGRYIAFYSDANNLIIGDTNLVRDVFVRDRQTGEVSRVSLGPGGIESNGKSDRPAISADGRYITFASDADNLIGINNDLNQFRDIFVHDRDPDDNGDFTDTVGDTILISKGSSDNPVRGNDDSGRPAISADGRFVVFYSDASNLVSLVSVDLPTFHATNCPLCTGSRDIFVRDRDPDGNQIFDEATDVITTRITITSNEGKNGFSSRPAFSGDGRYIVFRSASSSLVDGDNNNKNDVFLHELQTGTTTRVSVGPGGIESDGDSSVPSISSNGRYIAFRSDATNLSSGLPASVEQVYIVDRDTMNIMIASTSNAGVAGSDDSSRPAISADGLTITFYSDAHNFADGDVPTFHAITCSSCTGVRDVFVRSLDRDGDQILEVNDNCPNIANANQLDFDSDHIGDVCDNDRDGDGTLNFADGCPDDPNKSAGGDCGCGVADTDTDSDGLANCLDKCPIDPEKIEGGICGCGITDTDDGSGQIVCVDGCPDDPDKGGPGVCKCGIPDIDTDLDGVLDCVDNCPSDMNSNQLDFDTDGMGDVCDDDDDNDLVADEMDNCPLVANTDQSDADADGIGDVCDPDFDNGPGQPNPSPCGAFGMITLSLTFMGLSFLRRRANIRRYPVMSKNSNASES